MIVNDNNYLGQSDARVTTPTCADPGVDWAMDDQSPSRPCPTPTQPPPSSKVVIKFLAVDYEQQTVQRTVRKIGSVVIRLSRERDQLKLPLQCSIKRVDKRKRRMVIVGRFR